MTDRLDALTTNWQDYAQAESDLTEDQEKIAYDELSLAIETAARRDRLLLDELRDVGAGRIETSTSRTSSGLSFADVVRSVLTPTPGVALIDPTSFRCHVEVSFTEDVMPIELTLALPVAGDLMTPGTDGQALLLEHSWTWFAGVPVVPSGAAWPLDHTGRPLHHVLQVSLGDEALNVGGLEQIGLPDTGVLQFFHDLETTGSPGDGARAGWHVRYLADIEDQRDSVALAPWPDELSLEARVPTVPINADLLPSVRSPLDVPSLSEEEFERYERLRAQLDWWPYERNLSGLTSQSDSQGSPWAPNYAPSLPVSHLGGFPHGESNPHHVKTLETELPLAPGDRHVLLAEINPMQFADAAWFHGGRMLEVWIRATDLAEHQFANVWCHIRTDC